MDEQYFEVVVQRHYTYKIVLTAEDAHAAREQVRELEIEDLEEFETDAYFDYGLAEELETCMSCEGLGYDVRDEDCGNCEGYGYLR
jgi:DnaJ-class molecular chaperone